MNDKETRGAMLQKLAAAPIAIGALAALRAEAQAAATMDPKAAGYVTHPNGNKECDGCALFIPAKTNPTKANGTCQVVKGSISPKGYCNLFSPKAK